MLAFPLTTLIAAVVEGIFGYPERTYRLIKHPVVWQGNFITALDRGLNRQTASRSVRIASGGVATVALSVMPSVCAMLVARLSRSNPVVCGVLASSCVAQRSLYEHVEAVALALESEGLEAGRHAVSMIVGRDPSTLDEAAICRAAIESLAENFSDGVVAPLVWCFAFGLPGSVFYKAINTADSMIGHRNTRYEAFGKCAARVDDLINLPASRLAALWLVLAAWCCGLDWREALRTVWRDAAHHRSPNAGWPEGALAGALGLSIGGPRVYDGVLNAVHWVGHGRRDLTSADIRAALRLYRRACFLQGAVLGAFSLVSFIQKRKRHVR